MRETFLNPSKRRLCVGLVQLFIRCQISLSKTEERMSTMRAVQLKEFGGPEALYVGDVAWPVAGDHQVVVRVYASAINRADTLQVVEREGKYPPPPGDSDILGLEAAGTVESVGTSVTKWIVGDRVMALVSGGGNAEFVAVNENHLIRVPPQMSFVHAAAIPEVWLTAYQLLHFVGQVQPNDVILVHAGGSGVGTAVVQLAKLVPGARTIVTAGTADKIELAKSLGASDGFNYKDGPFHEKVRAATGGGGVDLVLDCVGGSYWQQNADALTIDGRWVIYGSMGGVNVDGPILGKILAKRLSVLGTTLRTRSVEYKARLISAFEQNALPRFIDGTLKPIIASVLPLDGIADAHRLMSANENAGKIILQVVPDARSDL